MLYQTCETSQGTLHVYIGTLYIISTVDSYVTLQSTYLSFICSIVNSGWFCVSPLVFNQEVGTCMHIAVSNSSLNRKT